MSHHIKTVLITGSSSGLGRAAAILFQKMGWNVAATMRNPEKEKELNTLNRVLCLRLDVTAPGSIDSAIQTSVEKFGGIDVLVNNAGYGLTGPFEGISEEQIRRQFETNVFGLMRVTRSVLPVMRAKKAGIIINISSVGGRVAFPYYSIYHATKWAVEGFSESLRFELEPLGIRIKIIEPGAINTDFYTRTDDSATNQSPTDYKELTDIALPNMNHMGKSGSSPEEIAKSIYEAANHSGLRLRFPAGMDAKSLLFLRRFITDRFYASIVRSQVFKR